jgi:hypothetical protein
MAIIIGILKILGTAVVGLVGWWAGLISARLVQEREQLERQHGILLTLREEVARLRTEIGPPPEESLELSIFGSRPAVPSIHPWIHGIIAETATIDPAIVRDFLQLDRLLNNLGVSKGQRDRMVDRAEEARILEREAKGADEANPNALEDYGTFTVYLEKKRAREQAEQTVERLGRFYEISHKQVRSVLSQLDHVLDAGIQRTEEAKVSGVWGLSRRLAGLGSSYRRLSAARSRLPEDAKASPAREEVARLNEPSE